jgi:pilus assembly protein Flp/PilA
MLVQKARQFFEDESGATAIEYGLIAALVAVGLIVAFGVLGDGLQNLFGATEAGAGGAIERAASTIN